MNRRMIAFAIAIGAIAAIAFWRAGALVGEVPLPSATAPVRAPQEEVHSVAKSTSIAKAALARPLFDTQQARGHSAASSAGEATSQVPGTKPQAPRLIGVIADGEHRVALVAYNGNLLRLREKTTFGEWMMIRIEPRAALVRANNRSEMLWLDAAQGKAADLIPESQ